MTLPLRRNSKVRRPSAEVGHRRHLRVGLLVTLMAITTAIVGAPPAVAVSAASAPYCGITWGSQAKSSSPLTGQQLRAVRAGRHDCYDRLVLDIGGRGGGRVGYTVSYVAAVRAEGSGVVVPVRGGARLQISIHAPAHDTNGVATYRPANPRELVNPSGFVTFRQVAWGGTFEGYTTIGLGVRARLPFRVFVLTGPGTGQRLVIDVAHRW